MITSRNGMRYATIGVGFSLVCLGGVGIYLGSHYYPFRALGLLAVLAAAYLFRTAAQSGPAKEQMSFQHPKGSVPLQAGLLQRAKGPGPLLWGVSIALLPVLGVAFLLVQNDAVNGGHEAWPLDILFGHILVCCIVWAILTTKLMRRRR